MSEEQVKQNLGAIRDEILDCADYYRDLAREKEKDWSESAIDCLRDAEDKLRKMDIEIGKMLKWLKVS